jgi:hypothetical protein
MSEPTSGSSQPPDPDQGQGQNPSQDEIQDQTSESVFNDATGPVWADPTTPIPAPSAPMGETHPRGQQPAANPQATPPSPPPMGNPYALQPPARPYGQRADQYGHPWPGQQDPAYGQQFYATGAPTEANTSALVLTILSALSLCNFLTVGSLILGIVALTKNSTDPQGSRRLTQIGWIVFAVVWGLVIVGVVGAIALGIVSNGMSTPNSSF